MNEFAPWSRPGSEATAEEREILGAAPDVSPPAGAQERVWGALTAAVGAAAVGTSVAGSVGAAKAFSGASQAGAHFASQAAAVKTAGSALAKPVAMLVLKAFVVGSLGGAAAVGTGVLAERSAFWGSPHASTPQATREHMRGAARSHGTVMRREPLAHGMAQEDTSDSTAASMATGSAPGVVEPAPGVVEPGSGAAEPATGELESASDGLDAVQGGFGRRAAPASTESAPVQGRQPAPDTLRAPDPTPSSKHPSDAVSRLEAEARLVREARTRMQQGDLEGASAKLETAQSEFGRGALAQEREALAIEILWRSGRPGAASARAKTFLRSYPDSPHTPRVLRALRNPGAAGE